MPLTSTAEAGAAPSGARVAAETRNVYWEALGRGTYAASVSARAVAARATRSAIVTTSFVAADDGWVLSQRA